MKSTSTIVFLLAAMTMAPSTTAFSPQPQHNTMRPFTSSNAQSVTCLSAFFKTKTETATPASASKDDATTDVNVNQLVVEDEADKEKKNLFQKIKDAGIAGSISLFLWEGAFWAISIPLACIAYYQTVGHWPDFGDSEDLAKVGAEAFAFANVARFALPVRIGLAVSTTPWVQQNIVDKSELLNKKKDE